MHYFDYNATTPLSEEAREAWLSASHEAWQNPSSPYRQAARVHVQLESARDRLAGMLGCPPGEIIFNAGATEANNSLLAYIKHLYPECGRVLVSAVEHPSVLVAAQHYFGERCELIPVDSHGALSLPVLEDALKEGGVTFVSVMAANNETGVIQPWEKLLSLCRSYGVPYHCDASQWLGKYPAGGLGACDCLTGCAHKWGGPKGVGFLKISPTFSGYQAGYGGAQEQGHRAGTENYPGIAAMLTALETVEKKLPDLVETQQSYVQTFEKTLQNKIKGISIVGEGVERLWNTTSFIMPKHDQARWVARLDRCGFAISTGAACAAGKAAPSSVLAAMGYAPDATARAVRISGGWETQGSDWEALAQAFIEAWEWLESNSSSSNDSQVITFG